MPLEKAGTDEVVQVLGQCSSWWPPQRACYFLIVLRAFGELLDDLPIDRTFLSKRSEKMRSNSSNNSADSLNRELLVATQADRAAEWSELYRACGCVRDIEEGVVGLGM